ncbi:hypothetical protein HAP94_07295 [Acidithiobacillus ferrivorans]|uniref:Uncharacterized protein n=1 Tax=mine drainage metagenome TaxID=410659 RepID=E6QAA4_9ZZZZ|nr:hypothetical protein [Acidithiobacillus ferrivorans]
MKWLELALIIIVAALVAFWIGHQGHVGLGSRVAPKVGSGNHNEMVVPWMALPPATEETHS